MIDAFLAAVGLKKALAIAGMVGGAIGAGVMPGVLATLGAVWKRALCGAACGGAIAGYGAEPLALALAKPEYVQGLALGLGLFGLSFVFKVLKAWNDYDLSSALGKLLDRGIGLFGGNSTKGGGS